MKTTRILAAAALIVASALAPSVVLAQSAVLVQPPGIKRTDLMRHDLSAPGREVIQVLVEFAPGVAFPNHSHPGEELVYVIEGLLEYRARGQAAGDAQGRRCAVHPGRSTSRGEERRQQQCGGDRHVYR